MTATTGPVERPLPAWLTRSYHVFGYAKVAGAVVSGIALFGMMVWIVLDVASRNLRGTSISGSFEFTQNYFMPLAVFPALAFVYASGVLPRMDLLVPKFGYRVQKVTSLVLLAIEIVLLALLTYYTWDYAMSGMERGTAFPAGGNLYPIWPAYFLAPIGLGMALVEVAFSTARNILGRVTALDMTDHDLAHTSEENATGGFAS